VTLQSSSPTHGIQPSTQVFPVPERALIFSFAISVAEEVAVWPELGYNVRHFGDCARGDCALVPHYDVHTNTDFRADHHTATDGNGLAGKSFLGSYQSRWDWFVCSVIEIVLQH